MDKKAVLDTLNRIMELELAGVGSRAYNSVKQIL